MSEYICFLITFVQLSEEWGNRLAKAAVKVHRDQLKHGVSVAEYPREYEEEILSLAPAHVRSVGPVVDIEVIFEVADPAMTDRYFTIIAIEDSVAGEHRYYVKRPGSYKHLDVTDPEARHLLRRLLREVPEDEEDEAP